MYYEINVSLNGQHFFATAERSIHDMEKLLLVFESLRHRFSTKDGYEITISERTNSGRTMTYAEVMDYVANLHARRKPAFKTEA
jgi:hypothetical protein